MYVECFDEDTPCESFRSSSPCASSPEYRMDLSDLECSRESSFHAHSPRQRKDSHDHLSFKRLFNIIHDKVQLLTDQTKHLREEVAEKNGTINKLLDFINKFARGNEDNQDDNYNNSVEEYNERVAEHNLKEQKKNITTRKRKSNEDRCVVLNQTERPPPVTTSPPAVPNEELLFLRNEIAQKNRTIDFLMHGRASDPRHRLIMDDDEDDDDELETVPLPMDNESTKHDDTLEVMERLFIEDRTSMSNLEDGTSMNLSSEDLLGATKEDEDLLEGELDIETIVHLNETKEPEEEPTSKEDLINIRIDKMEEMILNMKKGTETTQEMSSVAPWDQHSNGFASSYMVKNGHEPGKGLGKTGNGIIEPIQAEKNTLDAKIDVSTWQHGTILVAGDSMIGGLEEKKMSKTGKVKVRSHGGATIKDMRDHLNAHLRKKPDRLIIHVHSNDASNKETSADDMFDRLMDLKAFAEGKVPNMKVTFACPIIRTDSTIANAKQMQLKNRLKRSGLDIVVNDNIEKEDLARKGLHLKPSGSRKLATNILSYLRSV